MDFSTSRREAGKGVFVLLAASILAVGIVLLTGCAKSTGGSDDETPPPAKPKTVVYTAGYYNNGLDDIPCYWKDGSRVELPVDPAMGPFGGYANAIAVSAGTVYTAGTQSGGDSSACYWKGTTRTDLVGSNANAISLAGGTVYALVTGDWSSGGITAFGGAYYAGATLNRLHGMASGDPARPERDTTANDIAVEGGTVYTAGQATDGTYQYASFWTGTTRTQLDTMGSEAKSICASGGTVYTAGSYYNGKTTLACFWTGTSRTILPVPAGTWSAYAMGIAVVDGTVYVAGYYITGTASPACYWTTTPTGTTTRTDLPDKTHGASAYGICVFEGVVYTVGSCSDGSIDIPGYWKGTTRVDLPGGTSDSYATDIVVVKE